MAIRIQATIAVIAHPVSAGPARDCISAIQHILRQHQINDVGVAILTGKIPRAQKDGESESESNEKCLIRNAECLAMSASISVPGKEGGSLGGFVYLSDGENSGRPREIFAMKIITWLFVAKLVGIILVSLVLPPHPSNAHRKL